MTLTEFLLARIAEDEAEANAADGTPTPIGMWDDERVLAECEAKRRIVEMHAPIEVYRSQPLVCTICVTTDDSGGYVVSGPEDVFPCPTLRALASVYADHPDYDEAWRP